MNIINYLSKFLSNSAKNPHISVKEIQHDRLAGIKSTVFNVGNGLNLSSAIKFSYRWHEKNHPNTSIVVYKQKTTGEHHNPVLSRFWMDEFSDVDFSGHLDGVVVDFCFVENDHYNGRDRFEIIIQDGVN